MPGARVILPLIYALKAGAALSVITVVAGIGYTTPIAIGLLVLGVAVPDLLVLAAVVSKNGEALASRRRLAFWMEMGAAAGMALMGAMHFNSPQSGKDEILLAVIYLALSLPMLLLAQLNHIPFDAEKEGPL